MRKINKIINIALIFMIIGVFIGQDSVYSFNGYYLRIPLNSIDAERINKAKYEFTRPRPLKELRWDRPEDARDIVTHFRALAGYLGKAVRWKPITIDELKEEAGKYDTYNYKRNPEAYFRDVQIGYFDLAQSGAYDAFIKRFTTGEDGAYWFRSQHEGQVKAIGDYAESLLNQDPYRTITVLDGGTGNGEEAFSIFIKLKERFPEAKIKVIGMDKIAPEPQNINWLNREHGLSSLDRKTLSEYFVEVTELAFAFREDTLGAVELRQGDIKDMSSFKGKADIVVINGVLGQELQGYFITILENVNSWLNIGGRLFVYNETFMRDEDRVLFSKVIDSRRARGMFDIVKRYGGIVLEKKPERMSEVILPDPRVLRLQQEGLVRIRAAM